MLQHLCIHWWPPDAGEAPGAVSDVRLSWVKTAIASHNKLPKWDQSNTVENHQQWGWDCLYNMRRNVDLTGKAFHLYCWITVTHTCTIYIQIVFHVHLGRLSGEALPQHHWWLISDESVLSSLSSSAPSAPSPSSPPTSSPRSSTLPFAFLLCYRWVSVTICRVHSLLAAQHQWCGTIPCLSRFS